MASGKDNETKNATILNAVFLPVEFDGGFTVELSSKRSEEVRAAIEPDAIESWRENLLLLGSATKNCYQTRAVKYTLFS